MSPVFVPPCRARLGAIKAGRRSITTSLDVYNVSNDNADQFDTLVSFVIGTGANRARMHPLCSSRSAGLLPAVPRDHGHRRHADRLRRAGEKADLRRPRQRHRPCARASIRTDAGIERARVLRRLAHRAGSRRARCRRRSRDAAAAQCAADCHADWFRADRPVGRRSLPVMP